MVKKCLICKHGCDLMLRRELHRFPTEITRRTEWCRIINRKPDDVPKSAYLCSDHFCKRDYNGLRNNGHLKNTAVPHVANILPPVPLPVPVLLPGGPGEDQNANAQVNVDQTLSKRRKLCEQPVILDTLHGQLELSTDLVCYEVNSENLCITIVDPTLNENEGARDTMDPITTDNQSAGDTLDQIHNDNPGTGNLTLNESGTDAMMPAAITFNDNFDGELQLNSTPMPPTNIHRSTTIPTIFDTPAVSQPAYSPVSLPADLAEVELTSYVQHQLVGNASLECEMDKENIDPKAKKVTPKTKLIKSLRAKVRKGAFELRKCKKKLPFSSPTTNETLSNLFPNAPSELKEFLTSQCQRFKSKPKSKRKGKNYSDFEISSAFTIFYHCKAKGYRYLREAGFMLPCLRTIQNWISKLDVPTGLSEITLACIANSTSNFSSVERDCVLLWDEMRIKQLVQYDRKRDSLIGVVDYGEEERNADEFANEALVFMVKGIYKNWCYPISYHFSNGPTGEHTINRLMLNAIDQLHGIGLTVRVVMCDQGITNQNVFRLQEISDKKNFIERNGEKVYFMHDPCHIVKLVRTHLKTHGFNYERSKGCVLLPFNEPSPQQTSGIGTAKWESIDEFYCRDIGTENRLAPKLSEAHFKLTDITKMKVRLATQILSNTVAKGICFMVQSGFMREESIDTALFVKKMNDLFDLLNISKPRDKVPFKCGINFFRHLPILKEFKEWVDTWACADGSRLPDCVNGLKLTILSLLDLSLELKERGYKYILTRRIQQDALEHWFGYQRSAIGNSTNPTAWQFANTWRKLLLTRIAIVSDGSNCEPGETTKNKNPKFSTINNLIKQISPKDLPKESVLPELVNFEHEPSEFESGSSDSDYIDEFVRLSTLDVWNDYFGLNDNEKLSEKDENVAVYMGNWACKSVCARVKCDNCAATIFCQDSNQSFSPEEEWTRMKSLKENDFLNPKPYSFGHRINDSTKEVIVEVFKYFRNATSSVNYSTKGIKLAIYNYLLQHKPIKSWVEQCKDHRTNIIFKVLLAKIFLLVKDLNKRNIVIRSTKTTIAGLRHA